MGSITGIVNTDVKKDYNKAVCWLEKSAKQGFAIAQCSLGLCYLDEEWENADVNKAIEYFNLSAKQGYFLAEYFLAICYYDGIGVEQDYNKAVEYYAKIAKMENFYENTTSMMKSENVFFGSQESAFVTEIILKSVKPMQSDAQYTLGNCYYNGIGVEKNVFTAAYWYLFAANNGSAEAQSELGRLYYLGEGVPQNYSIAVEWFSKSAEQGDDVAQFNLGVCYELGKGVEQDLEKAIYWYKKSAEQGYADAVKALKILKKKI